MNNHKSLWGAVCLLAMLSLTMYGCGGGGGSSSSDGMPDSTPPVMTEPTAEQQAAAEAAVMAAKDAAAAATAAIDVVMHADPMAAQDAADAATAAAALVDPLDETTVTAANDAAGAAAMAVTALNAEETRLVAEAERLEAIAEAERLEAIAEAAETAAKLVAGYIGPDNSTRADDDDATAGIQVPVTVESNSEGTQLLGDLDIKDEPPVFDGEDTAMDMTDDFVKSTEAVASLGSRWKGGKYTRTQDGVSDTIVKYADKGDPKNSDFAAYFAGSRDGVDGSSSDGGVLTLTTSQAGNHGLFSINFGIDSRNQENPITHAEGESSTEFTGRFTGVPGTFSCTGTCSVGSDEKGNLDMLTGSWDFTPDGIEDLEGAVLTTALGKISVPGVLPDADYMIFGYWLQETTDEDGKVTRAFSTFTDGNQPYGGVAPVMGTATYAGPATGMYMKKSLTPEGQPARPFNSGQFTADATLSASFGGNSVAVNDQFSITGSISNFMDGSEMINEQWVVNLNRPKADASTNISATAGTFSGVTSGGKLGSAAGTFSGMFHGPSADNVLPSSASGIFDGHFSNGHVMGAFGAHKQAE